MNVSFESLLSGGGIISSLPKTKHGIYLSSMPQLKLNITFIIKLTSHLCMFKPTI